MNNSQYVIHEKQKHWIPATSWGDIGLIIEGALLTAILIWIAISLHKLSNKR